MNWRRLSEGSYPVVVVVEDTTSALPAGDMTLAEADRTFHSSVEEEEGEDTYKRTELRQELRLRCADKNTARSHHSSDPAFSSY
jgi:hypothetical protein